MSIVLISYAYASETEGQIGANFGPILEGNVTHTIPEPSSTTTLSSNTLSGATQSQNTNSATPSPTPITATTAHTKDGLLSFELHHNPVIQTRSSASTEGDLALVITRPISTPIHTPIPEQQTATILENTPPNVREVLYNPLVDISALAIFFTLITVTLFYKKP